METTKMATTKKSAIKPNKRFLGAGTKRMTKRSLQNSKSGSRLFYQIALTRTAEPKKKVIAAMAPKPEPTMPPMNAPRLAELMSRLPGTILPGPNKSLTAAMRDLFAEADDLLKTVLMCKFPGGLPIQPPNPPTPRTSHML